MVKKEDLHWSEEDTKAVIQYKEDVNAGKIAPVKLIIEPKEFFQIK